MKVLLAALLVATGLLLSGCSGTPKHSNVLIFGTNTKFALDVSQDMTSGVGVTLGYKREEAVWMPLLPNQGDEVGTNCATAECRKYTGNQGSDRDTYSVLASFGSKSRVGADGQQQQPSAQLQGDIAQYFATGLAARELAQSGGAGLVNTQALNLTPEQQMRARLVERGWASDRQTVLQAVRASNPALVDADKMKGLLAKATGEHEISSGAKRRLQAATTLSQVEQALIVFDRDAATLATLTH
jgi:hypothetical protein